jgi:hypothetical protein
MLSVALALAVQAAPCQALIDNLPDQAQQTAVTLSPDVPLVELLNAQPGLAVPAAAPHVPRVETTPTIYAHVNRVRDCVAPAADVAAALTSHSFRRGGAQHANGYEEMTARWIFERGAWNLTTTNKGFSYILNTSREDHKIAKVLSRYEPKADVQLQDLSSFDSHTLESIGGVQCLLFAACYQLESATFNISRKVLDVLTACALRQYPLLKDLNPESPYIKRVEVCVAHAGCSLADLLAWSTHLAQALAPCEDCSRTDTPAHRHEPKPTEPSYEMKVIDHQAAVIKHLIENQSLQDARMNRLEAKLNGDPAPPARKSIKADEDADEGVRSQRRSNAEDRQRTCTRLGSLGTPRSRASKLRRRSSCARGPSCLSPS